MQKQNSKFPKRSLSRLIAVQSFYQYDFHERKISVEALAEGLTQNYFLSEEEKIPSCEKKIDSDLLQSLLCGLITVKDKIDDEITPFLKGEWRIDNLPDVMLQILRLGSFELKYMKDTPTKVIINEYVDLSSCFYDAKQVTFVNKALQNIANKNRPESKTENKTEND